jgi:hypothetical protein
MPDDDALELAKTELATEMVPDPIDILQDCGPLAQLWFAHQAAYGVMQSFIGMQSGVEGEVLPDDSEPVRALAALAKACGNLDAACQLLNLLPADDATT